MQQIQNIYPNEIKEYIDNKSVIIIDLREKREYEQGHVRGSVNIQINDLEKYVYQYPRDKIMVVYCKTGARSIIAARILKQYGYQVKNVIGGMKNYL